MLTLGVDLGTTWTAAACTTATPSRRSSSAPPVRRCRASSRSPTASPSPATPRYASAATPRQPSPVSSNAASATRPRSSSPARPYGPETLTGHLLAHVVATAPAPVTARRSHARPSGDVGRVQARPAARGRPGRRASATSPSSPNRSPPPATTPGSAGSPPATPSPCTTSVAERSTPPSSGSVPTAPSCSGRAEGLDRLGGVDLDQAVLAHVDAALDGALRAMDRDNPDVRRAALELRAECVAAKEALSADTETTIAVRFPSLNTDVRITRPEFEAAVRPRVADTLSALDRAIASASLSVGDLAGVVLVGGSSRIPMVAEQVAAHTGPAQPRRCRPQALRRLRCGGARPSSAHQPPRGASRRHHGATPCQTALVPRPLHRPLSPSRAAAPQRTPPPRRGRVPPPRPVPAVRRSRRSARPRRSAARRPRNAPKEQSGLSTAGKVAAGVAAAGAATAAGVLWHDDVTDALGITGDDETPPPTTPLPRRRRRRRGGRLDGRLRCRRPVRWRRWRWWRRWRRRSAVVAAAVAVAAAPSLRPGRGCAPEPDMRAAERAAVRRHADRLPSSSPLASSSRSAWSTGSRPRVPIPKRQLRCATASRGCSSGSGPIPARAPLTRSPSCATSSRCASTTSPRTSSSARSTRRRTRAADAGSRLASADAAAGRPGRRRTAAREATTPRRTAETAPSRRRRSSASRAGAGETPADRRRPSGDDRRRRRGRRTDDAAGRDDPVGRDGRWRDAGRRRRRPRRPPRGRPARPAHRLLAMPPSRRDARS